MQRIQGTVQQGNTKVHTGGLQSSTLVQGSFPSATATVFVSSPPPLAIVSISRTGNVVTVVMPAGTNFIAGNSVTIAGVLDATYNGSFTIATVIGVNFTYNQIGSNSSSSGGTAQSILLANVFQDNVGTPLTNPFTTNSDGSWGFYAGNGRYDIRFSGAGLGSPFTITDNILEDLQFPTLIPTTVTIGANFKTPGTNTIASGYFAFGVLDPPQNASPSNALIGLSTTVQFDTAHPNSDGRGNAGLMGIQGLLIVNNTTGTNGFNNAGILGDCEVIGAGGTTGECYGGIFLGHISNGIITNPLAGINTTVSIDGGTVNGTAAAIWTQVNQTGGAVNGELAGIIVNSISPSGGTRTKIVGVQINDMQQANTALQVGNADNATGLSVFYGSVGIFGNGGEFNDNSLLRVGPSVGTVNLTIFPSGNITTAGNVDGKGFSRALSQRIYNPAFSNWTVIKNTESGGSTGYGIYVSDGQVNPDVYIDPNGNVSINQNQAVPRSISNAFCVGTADQFQVSSGGKIQSTAGINVSGANIITLGSVLFASLPASPNGSIIYCTDCNATCTAGGSTGRTCFRENSVWTH